MMDELNLTFAFKLASNNTGASSVATGDSVFYVLAVFVILFFATALLFFLLKKKCQVKLNPKHNSCSVITYYNNRMLFTMFIGVSVIASLLIFFGCLAYAKTNDSVIDYKKEIPVYINEEQNTISIDEGWIKNITNENFYLDASCLAIEDSLVDEQSLKNVKLNIQALNGTVYNGSPTGEIIKITDIKQFLSPNVENTLYFQLDNLSISDALRLVGKNVFKLKLFVKLLDNPISNIVVPEEINVNYDKQAHGQPVQYDVMYDADSSLFYRKQNTTEWEEGFQKIVNCNDSGIYEFKIVVDIGGVIYEELGEYNPIYINKISRNVTWQVPQGEFYFPDNVTTTYIFEDEDYEDGEISFSPDKPTPECPVEFSLDSVKRSVVITPIADAYGIDITMYVKNGKNYKDSFCKKNITVNAGLLNFKVNEVNVVYDANYHCVNIEAEQDTPNGILFEYDTNSTGDYAYKKTWTNTQETKTLYLDSVAFLEATTDIVWLRIRASLVGYSSFTATVPIMISPRPVEIKWSSQEPVQSFTYNKTSQFAQAEFDRGEIRDYDIEPMYCLYSITPYEKISSAIDAGRYRAQIIGIKYKYDTSYTQNYCLPAQQDLLYKNFNINPAPVKLKWDHSGASSWIYGGKTATHSYNVSLDKDDIFSGDELSINTILYEDEQRIPLSDVYNSGDYKWVADQLNGKSATNYVVSEDSDISIAKTITKKTLSNNSFHWFNTDSLIYDGTEKHPIAESSDVVDGDTVTFIYEIENYQHAIDAGEYNIRVSSLGPQEKNYSLPAPIPYLKFNIQQAQPTFEFFGITSSVISIDLNVEKNLSARFTTDENINIFAEDSTSVEATFDQRSSSVGVLNLRGLKYSFSMIRISTLGSKNYKALNLAYAIDVTNSEDPSLFIVGRVCDGDPSFEEAHVFSSSKEGAIKFSGKKLDGSVIEVDSVVVGDGHFKITNLPENIYDGTISYVKDGYAIKRNNIALSDQPLYLGDLSLQGPDLNNYSWDELSMISNEISELKSSSEYYREFVYYAQHGTDKEIENLGLAVRIIGINHDFSTADRSFAALTFMTVASSYTGNQEMPSSNYGSWTYSKSYFELNSSDGTIYNELLANIGKDNVKTVAKTCAFGWVQGKYYDTLRSLPCTFFLPSAYELLGITNVDSVRYRYYSDDNKYVVPMEGTPYEYISNDIWNILGTNWHATVAKYKQLPVMSGPNMNGYKWLLGEKNLGSHSREEGLLTHNKPVQDAELQLSLYGGKDTSFCALRTIAPDNNVTYIDNSNSFLCIDGSANVWVADANEEIETYLICFCV